MTFVAGVIVDSSWVFAVLWDSEGGYQTEAVCLGLVAESLVQSLSTAKQICMVEVWRISCVEVEVLLAFLDVEDLEARILVGLEHLPVAEVARMKVAEVFSVSSCWVWEQ